MPGLEKHKLLERLVSKNVAENIGQQVCESVCSGLLGKQVSSLASLPRLSLRYISPISRAHLAYISQVSSFASLSSTVKASMEGALSCMMTGSW